MRYRCRLSVFRCRSKLTWLSLAFVVVVTTSVAIGYVRRMLFPSTELLCRFSTSSLRQITLAQQLASSMQTGVIDDDGRHCSVFHYGLSGGRPLRRKPFLLDTNTLSNLGLPMNSSSSSGDFNSVLPPSWPSNESQFVVLTAADSYYFDADMDAIGLVQQYLPGHVIIFYDLSAESTHTKIVDKVRKLCNVQYVAFNFSRYPPHVRNLYNYAWKPLVIHELLITHKAVLWIDSSIRVKHGPWNDVIKGAISKGGIVMFGSTGHSILSATHSTTFDYLPLDEVTAVRTRMLGASAIFIFLNQQNYFNVLRWWFLCALVPDCIAPTTDIYCKFADGHARDSTYADCHRYDQSALNILLVNHVAARQFTSDTDELSNLYSIDAPLGAFRRSRLNQPLHVCSGGSTYSPSRVVQVDEYFE